MGANCTSAPLRASTGLSPGFTLPRPRSPGFWSRGRDFGPFQTPSLTGAYYIALLRFMGFPQRRTNDIAEAPAADLSVSLRLRGLTPLSSPRP